MKNKKRSIGHLNVGDSPENKRRVELVDKIICKFKDKRTATVARTEEDTYMLVMENDESTDRCPQQLMHLTEGSFISMLAACLLYMHRNNMNLDDMLAKYSIDPEDGNATYYYASIND